MSKPQTSGSVRRSVWWGIAALLVGAGAGIGAILANGRASGSLPWSASSSGLLLTLSALLLGVSVAAFSQAAARARDERVRAAVDADRVIGCLTNPLVKGGIRRATGRRLRYLPGRATLALSRRGLQMWGPPGMTEYVRLPLEELREFRASVVPGAVRSFTALGIVTVADELIELPVVLDSATGMRSPSLHRVQAIAADFNALLNSWRNASG